MRKLGPEKWNLTLLGLLADIKHVVCHVPPVCITINSFQSISHLYLMRSQQPVDKAQQDLLVEPLRLQLLVLPIFSIMIHIGN